MSERVKRNRVVALTGATGFVGGHILRQLANADYRVRVLARNPDKLPAKLADQDVVVGALDDESALDRLSAGADAFIHCAGSVRGVTKSQFAAVNVDGSAACSRAAIRHGVERFLLISSLAAREPQLSAYAASKRGGEEAVLEATATAGEGITALADAVESHWRRSPTTTRCAAGQERMRRLLASAAAERVRNLVLGADGPAIGRGACDVRAGDVSLAEAFDDCRGDRVLAAEKSQ